MTVREGVCWHIIRYSSYLNNYYLKITILKRKIVVFYKWKLHVCAHIYIYMCVCVCVCVCVKFRNYTIFPWMQDDVFLEIWCLSMWGGLKFAYEGPYWTVPINIALNWTIWSQTKACIAKSPCVDKKEHILTIVIWQSSFFGLCPLF